MKALVVLSHLMTKDGILEVESEARAKLAIDKFSSNKHHHRRHQTTQNQQTSRLFVRNHRYLINEISKLL
mgnify:CR=1 FL=1